MPDELQHLEMCPDKATSSWLHAHAPPPPPAPSTVQLARDMVINVGLTHRADADSDSREYIPTADSPFDCFSTPPFRLWFHLCFRVVPVVCVLIRFPVGFSEDRLFSYKPLSLRGSQDLDGGLHVVARGRGPQRAHTLRA